MNARASRFAWVAGGALAALLAVVACDAQSETEARFQSDGRSVKLDLGPIESSPCPSDILNLAGARWNR